MWIQECLKGVQYYQPPKGRKEKRCFLDQNVIHLCCETARVAVTECYHGGVKYQRTTSTSGEKKLHN